MAVSIPLSAMKSANAGDVSYSVARISGSTEISADIVGDAIEVTVPADEAPDDRRTRFEVTAEVACIHDSARTDTDTDQFQVTVPGIGYPPSAPSLSLIEVTETTDLLGDVTHFRVAIEVDRGPSGPTTGSAASFTIQRSRSTAFSDPEERTRQQSGNFTWSIPVAETGAHYFRARGHNTAGDSPWSATLTVTLALTPLPVPTVTLASVGLVVSVTLTGRDDATQRYDVQWSAMSDFSETTDVADPSLVVMPATGTYWFRARVRAGSRVGSWSAGVSIDVVNPNDIGPPGEVPFTAVLADGDVTVTVGTPATGAPPTSWTINWGVDNTFAVGTATLTAPGAHVIEDVRDITTNLWVQVFASNADGDGATSFAIVNTYPTPTVTYDPAAPLAGQTVTATFSSTFTITQYEWQRLGSDGVTWENLAGETGTSYTIPDDTAVGTQFRIRWRRSQVMGYENGPAVAVAEPPPPPAADVPGLSVTQISDLLIVATVTAPASGPTPTSYEIQQATNAGFTGPQANATLTAPGDVTFSTVLGTDIETYYFRARSIHANGNSDWSDTVTLTLSPVAQLTMVTYDPPEEVRQAESVTATLPANTSSIQWQGFRSATMEWVDISINRFFDMVPTNAATLNVPAEAPIGLMLRVTYGLDDGTLWIASNHVTVIIGALDPDSMPTGLTEDSFDQSHSDPNMWVFVAQWTPLIGAAEYDMEVEYGSLTSILVEIETVALSASANEPSIRQHNPLSTIALSLREAIRWRVRGRQDEMVSQWSAWRIVDYPGDDPYRFPVPSFSAAVGQGLLGLTEHSAARVQIDFPALDLPDDLMLANVDWRVQRVHGSDLDNPPTFDGGADETVNRDASTADAIRETFDFTGLDFGHHAFRAIIVLPAQGGAPEVTSPAWSADTQFSSVIVSGPDAVAPGVAIRQMFDVGRVYVVTDGISGTTVQLLTVLSGNYDPALTYAWSVTGGTLDDPTSARPVWTRPTVTTPTSVTISVTVTATAHRPYETTDTATASVTVTVRPLVLNEVILGTPLLGGDGWTWRWVPAITIPINQLVIGAALAESGADTTVGFGLVGIRPTGMGLTLRQGVNHLGIGGVVGEFLSAEAKALPSLITLSLAGTDYVFPGPAYAGNAETDSTNPYVWGFSTAHQAVFQAFNAAVPAATPEQREAITMRLGTPTLPVAAAPTVAITSVAPLPSTTAPGVTIMAIPAGESGTDVQLSATLMGGTYDELEYAWTATGGSFDDATAASPTWTRPTVSADTDYTVTLVVTARGTGTNARTGTSATASDTETATVTAITPDAQAPSVSINAIPEGSTGASVALSAALSGGTYDTLEYAWSATGGSFDDATSATPSWTRPDSGGDYTVSLTVTARGTGTNATDGSSATASGSASASVRAPVSVTVNLGAPNIDLGQNLFWSQSQPYPDLSALGTANRGLQQIGISISTVIININGGGPHDLPDAWESNPAAITLSAPTLDDLVIPGPTAPGTTTPDPSDPYSWVPVNDAAVASWRFACQLLSDSQKAQVTATFATP